MVFLQIATGFCASVTVTVYEQVLKLPLASVAVHVTVVIPLLKLTLFNVLPLAVVAPDNAYVKVATEQLSVADASQLLSGFV